MQKSIIYKNYKFVLNNSNKKTNYYRCSKFNGGKCSARLIVKNNEVIEKGEHKCKNIIKEINKIENDELDQLIIKNSQNLSITPAKIYQNLINEIKLKNEETHTILPCKKTINSRIRELRGNEIPKIEAMFENEMGLTLDKNIFLRAYKKCIVYDKIESFAIWASEEGLSVLRQQGQIFIDGTFKIAPSNYKQCILIMGYDVSTYVYVPCVWCLMSAKNETMYWFFLQEVISLLDWRWDPKICVVDFENALINAVKAQLPKTKILGCFFHYKQSIIKKLKKIGIMSSNIEKISNELNFLTVLEKDKINIGIEYIKNKYKNSDEKFIEFMKYFEKTWLKKYDSDLWNIHQYNTEELISRTNNPLERYNRRLNEQFNAPHPNILCFINIIRNEENYYSTLIRGIRMGNIKRQKQRDEINLPKVPENFLEYFFNKNTE